MHHQGSLLQVVVEAGGTCKHVELKPSSRWLNPGTIKTAESGPCKYPVHVLLHPWHAYLESQD
jgi:hypothetical protein